jgi:hypothetical protein
MSLPIASQNTQYYLQAGCRLACAVASAEMALFVGALSFAVRSIGGVVFCVSVICGSIRWGRCLFGSIRCGRRLCGSICWGHCLLQFNPLMSCFRKSGKDGGCTALPRKSSPRNVLVAMPGRIEGLVLSSVKDNPTSQKF